MSTVIQPAIDFLDERLPNWRDSINVDRLDMLNQFDCVLGQLFGDWQRGLSILGMNWGGPNEHMRHYFSAYQTEWRTTIKPRSDVTVTLTPEAADLLLEILRTRVTGGIADTIGVNGQLQSGGAVNQYQTSINSSGNIAVE